MDKVLQDWNTHMERLTRLGISIKQTMYNLHIWKFKTWTNIFIYGSEIAQPRINVKTFKLQYDRSLTFVHMNITA